ncbi:unnamed protein product [Discosporangium mesarthrocarpum]
MVNSLLIKPCIAKMVRLMMRNGKKSKAESVLLSALAEVEQKYPGQSLYIFYAAVANAQPLVGVRKKPIGKGKSRKAASKRKTIYIPYPISAKRSQSLGMRALITSSQERSSLSISKSLSEELIMAAQSLGSAVDKKLSIHKIAKDNRGFTHFRW